jgi:DNA-directed RNA polymerase specialized sigma24 family protein
MDHPPKDRVESNDQRAWTAPLVTDRNDNGDSMGGEGVTVLVGLGSVGPAHVDGVGRNPAPRSEPDSAPHCTACGGGDAKHPAELTDRELIEAYQADLRDANDAFHELANRYKNAVIHRIAHFRNCRGFDAEEIWNQTLKGAWQHLPNFKFKDGAPDCFLKYLRKIALNNANTYVQRLPREEPSSAKMDLSQPSDPTPGPSRLLEAEELRPLLQGFVRSVQALENYRKQLIPFGNGKPQGRGRPSRETELHRKVLSALEVVGELLEMLEKTGYQPTLIAKGSHERREE